MTEDSGSDNATRLKVPFAEGRRSAEFGHAVLRKLTQRVNQLREEFVPPENIANMPHGHGWTFQQQRKEGFALETGEFEKHSAEISIGTERILSYDLRVLEEFVLDMAQRMNDTFMKGMIREIDETCTRFGRVTDIPKGASLADGILSGLADVHASVDADGNVSLPQLMLGSEMIERLKSEAAIRGEELERRADEIRAQIEKDARAREAERLTKYERP